MISVISRIGLSSAILFYLPMTSCGSHSRQVADDPIENPGAETGEIAEPNLAPKIEESRWKHLRATLSEVEFACLQNALISGLAAEPVTSAIRRGLQAYIGCFQLQARDE